MTVLKPCRWRGPARGMKFTCRSTKLIGAAAGVTADFCNTRCPYVDHEACASSTLRQNGACRYLGPETGELEDCRGCAGRVRLKVLACEMHGKVVPDRVCPTCSDYEPKQAKTVFDILPGLPDPLPYLPIEHSHREWANLPRVQRRFIEAFQKVLAMPAPRAGIAEGSGIVVCGGGKYWPMIAVAVHMARRVTRLPIQIWHRGAAEPIRGADIRGLSDITIHDATALHPLRRLGGWECKSVALLHCGLERALFMDADAYLVGDPAELVNLASPHRSLVFWKDFPDHWQHVTWPAFGLPREQKLGPIQGGQLVFHRPSCWRQLVIAHWLNQHSDYTYQHGYGDQDMWRVAWAASAGTFCDLGEIPYRDRSFVGAFNGRNILVHRVGDKLWGLANLHPKSALPEEQSLSKICDQLRRGTMGAGEVFAQVYARGDWAPAGTSGRGSTGVEAEAYLSHINELIQAWGWQRVVDLGCGDAFIARRLKAPEVIGVDCVSISEPPNGSASGYREFQLLDLDADRERLPHGDVALVKDVLHHWPTALVVEWLQWAARSGLWKVIVLTNDTLQADGLDCDLGGYRGLDPAKAPLANVPGLQRYTDFLHKSICVLECQTST